MPTIDREGVREALRQTVMESLKIGAPGLSDCTRQAITRSIVLKAEGRVFAAPAPAPAPATNWIDRCAWIAGQLTHLIRAKYHGPPERGDGESLGHLLYMAEELAARRVGSETKSCRWLGWLQAMMLNRDLVSLEECKKLNLRSGRWASRG